MGAIFAVCHCQCGHVLIFDLKVGWNTALWGDSFPALNVAMDCDSTLERRRGSQQGEQFSDDIATCPQC